MKRNGLFSNNERTNRQLNIGTDQTNKAFPSCRLLVSIFASSIREGKVNREPKITILAYLSYFLNFDNCFQTSASISITLAPTFLTTYNGTHEIPVIVFLGSYSLLLMRGMFRHSIFLHYFYMTTQ